MDVVAKGCSIASFCGCGLIDDPSVFLSRDDGNRRNGFSYEEQRPRKRDESF